MRRREFITLLCSATACPLAAVAQTPPKIPRVGYIASFLILLRGGGLGELRDDEPKGVNS
jgi:hypothetical protein